MHQRYLILSQRKEDYQQNIRRNCLEDDIWYIYLMQTPFK